MLTSNEFKNSLLAAGLKKNDTVLVQSNLQLMGRVKNRRTKLEILDFYYSNIMEAIGKEGTLVVLTAFEDYARYGLTFDRQNTKSLSGAFSEYVRTRNKAIRSLHPVLSLTAIGKFAKFLCEGNHQEGFGYDSAWGRFHRINGRILTVGYGVKDDGMTFLHYLENLYGVPYQYTKIFDYPIIDNGKTVKGCFTMPVRYLDFDIDYDQSKFKQILLDNGKAKQVGCGRGKLFATTADDIVEEGVKFLAKDRYGLLKGKPKFRRGEIPLDLKFPSTTEES